jgi:hypothetical protein
MKYLFQDMPSSEKIEACFYRMLSWFYLSVLLYWIASEEWIRITSTLLWLIATINAVKIAVMVLLHFKKYDRDALLFCLAIMVFSFVPWGMRLRFFISDYLRYGFS